MNGQDAVCSLEFQQDLAFDDEIRTVPRLDFEPVERDRNCDLSLDLEVVALQAVLQSWVNQVQNMPKKLQTITDTDLDGAQAYLRALQRKIQEEQAKLNGQGTTPTPAPTSRPKTKGDERGYLGSGVSTHRDSVGRQSRLRAVLLSSIESFEIGY